MKYLVVQDWRSTSGNHAGMRHMCELLVKLYPSEYEVYVKKIPNMWNLKGGLIGKIQNRIINRQRKLYISKVYPQEYMELCAPMLSKLKDGDEVFLLEYLLPWAPQYQLACFLRKNFPKVRLYALSHLTCKYFNEMTIQEPNIIKNWSEPVDRMLTLGSSLSAYFEKAGISRDKISTGFHYVDSEYYCKKLDLTVHSPLTVITMGALQRDYSLLAEVVGRCPDVHWIICRGRKNVDDMFPQTPNVELKGFMEEDELRHQMDIADVSLNVMEDTVGSNVITTSMAMGLAMIVSNVGSIKDYCDNYNSVFCENTVSGFSDAIHLLKSNKALVKDMKLASIKRSELLNIQKVHYWFSNL